MLPKDSNRQNVVFERKEHPEWHQSDLSVVTVFRRTWRAVCTLFDARIHQDSLQASPTTETPIEWPVMADMFDDGSHFLPSRVVPTWSNTLGGMTFIAEHAVK